MKKTRKSLIVAVAVMMIFASFSMLSLNIQALSPDYNGTNSTIYYFHDYYPSISRDDLVAKLESEEYEYAVVYDHQWLDEGSFTSLVSSGYFSGFNSEDIVIFDIKSFKPDDDTLETLFTNLKNIWDCKTIFITPYSQLEFTDRSFTNYLDRYIKINFEWLISFIGNSISEMITKNQTISNTAFLIDGRLVDTSSSTDINTLCEESPFLRALVEALADIVGDETEFTDYDAMADSIATANIKLYIHSDDDLFWDILGNQNHSAPTVMSFYDNNRDYICAFGFRQLESVFHNYLVNGQNLIGIESLPVFLMEVDPPIEGSGLSVTTDYDLAQTYGADLTESNLVWQALLDLLQ